MSEQHLKDIRPYALYLLLPLFGLIVVMALTVQMSFEPRPFKLEEGVIASVPHGPAEFKDILDIDPLKGLESGKQEEFPVAPPPLSDDIFPCTDCHDPSSDNPKRRELDEHTNVTLEHGGKDRWCLDCHDFADRDKLHLINGEKISFEESHRLCGQCHGAIYRDWKLGIHGKRTGYWNGPKRYLLCVNCHWPHKPAFKPLKPLPPPVRPEYLNPQADRPDERMMQLYPERGGWSR